MRFGPLLLATVLFVSAPAVSRAEDAPADPALAAALEQADELEGTPRHAEVPALLAPWNDAADPEVDFRIAYALFLAQMDGRRVEDFAKADLSEAQRYAERAAEHGSAAAMNLLYMIWNGDYGRPADMTKAMAWLERAAAAGDPGAKVNLGVMLFEGRPWIARDRDRACRLFVAVAAEEGAGAYSLYYLGLATLLGECGLDADEAKAADMIRRAAEGGVRDAERDYGKMLESGIGVAKDEAAALRWYETASGHGDGFSFWRLGMAHVEGLGGRPVDPAKAVAYFRQGIDNNSLNSMVSLAVMYATGSGVETDFAQALDLYRRAADAGDAHSYRALAWMAHAGEGQPVDPVKAMVLYSQGVALGNDEEPALRRVIEEGLSAEQRAEAERQFAAWQAARAK